MLALRPLSVGVDMTSTVKRYVAPPGSRILVVPFILGAAAFTKVAGAIGRGGACNSDG